ncbi:MAG: methanogenesis marker protein Mmp4/MtxX [Candidatus Methanomethylophilaceae archaeon]|nr:methanogenesis marker protein Mmp4/MtxX [Candidatus Methanomethylophilaceae archaeon]
MEGHDITIYNDPHELVDDLAAGNIDAAVRGDMSSAMLLPILKSRLGVKGLERVVFLEPPGGKLFILAPVGIDEGWSEEQRLDIAMRSADLARKVGMGDRIAILSGGRCEDVGRCKVVDRSIDSARALAKELNGRGYDAYHAQILVENAVKEADIILAQDGIIGNMLFRSLHFIGGLRSLGAPAINVDKVFIDTSRAKTDYRDSIALAMRLSEDSHVTRD